MKTEGRVKITPTVLYVDGKEEMAMTAGLNGLYRSLIADYPKFFKMDGFCKLGFIAAHILLSGIPAEEKRKGAVVLFSRSGSLATDRRHQTAISDPGEFFPSPSVFVYTLANILTGEIAIRHGINGETSCYLLDSPDPEIIDAIAGESLEHGGAPFVLTGWAEYVSDDEFLADMKIVRNR